MHHYLDFSNSEFLYKHFLLLCVVIQSCIDQNPKAELTTHLIMKSIFGFYFINPLDCQRKSSNVTEII